MYHRCMLCDSKCDSYVHMICTKKGKNRHQEHLPLHHGVRRDGVERIDTQRRSTVHGEGHDSVGIDHREQDER